MIIDFFKTYIFISSEGGSKIFNIANLAADARNYTSTNEMVMYPLMYVRVLRNRRY
jgi:hypothetical protein